MASTSSSGGNVNGGGGSGGGLFKQSEASPMGSHHVESDDA